MARSRRETRGQVDIWPGFVDALSTLLMAIIFLLVVFMLSQFLMGRLLEGQNADLGRMQSQVDDLSSRLDLERDGAAELRRNLTRLNADLAAALGRRDDLEAELHRSEAERQQTAERLGLLTDEQRLFQRTLGEMRIGREEAERQVASLRSELDQARQVVAADREKIELQLAQLVQLGRDIEALTEVRRQLEDQVAARAAELEQARGETRSLSEQLTSARDSASALEARLSTAEERTALAQRELSQRDIRIEELLHSASSLEQERDAAAAKGSEAAAEAAELNRQLVALSEQLRRLDEALGTKQAEIEQQSATIADLGQRLNMALASKVEELSQFRSEFFGRLRQVLGERRDVQIVGDRFVFQSEVLFDSGTAEIGAAGQQQLAALAQTLRDIASGIPQELPWVLQVDGHTDRRPINTLRFPSNWELSTARAISVARFLVSQGIPADRVAATGFAEFQPLDPADNEEAWRRNRRIEIKLTTR
ncbi:MAG TPA: peptidoglycan -binding protein [Geminicoccaceae bacterium]|mgnify:CR=1 FL=1|nr:peptidoglycan -binding protein [Geminicoccus sp.]HMU50717.1 peptidoglycan -binding protein [Geminicoccaceae bacterium]